MPIILFRTFGIEYDERSLFLSRVLKLDLRIKIISILSEKLFMKVNIRYLVLSLRFEQGKIL